MKTELDKNIARRHFSRAARSYDEWSRPQQVMADRLMTIIVDAPSPMFILEIGCGTGVLTARLMQAYPGAHILAVDIADGMVEACSRKFSEASDARFLVADAETLCVEGPFDLIASNSCLQWMSDLPDTLSRMRDLLSPEGLLMFSSPVEGTLGELWASYAAATDGASAGHPMPKAPDYEDALSRAGFSEICVDRQTLVFSYPSAEDAIQCVRQIGATRASKDAGRLTRNQVRMMTEHYQRRFPSDDGGVTCTYEVVYARARR